MTGPGRLFAGLAAVVCLAAGVSASGPRPAAAQASTQPAGGADGGGGDVVARGTVVFRAAGCMSCHTDSKNLGRPLAGGRPLITPFGTFYTPNITPDRDTGIGNWSVADLSRSLHEGLSPAGSHYYPAFPYTSYTGMTDQDVGDLWAFLMAQPPVIQANRPHELSLPFRFRASLGVWKGLFFSAGRFAPDPGRDAAWNRGAYLVQVMGHCGECHTPRGALGGLDGDKRLAGTAKGPDGKKVPNITPHPQDGIGKWTESDISYFLKTGIFPDGDAAGGAMVEVIEDGTSFLDDSDRSAIARYLLDLPPIAGP
ncbi:MAG TPA: cytochrome c [Kiloniellales bacterium]